ncbi:MAG: hypothetical protein RJA07_835 [Bacteroidota bacterium]|jgi:hypothetical protein
MKHTFLSFLFLLFTTVLFAQQKKDTLIHKKNSDSLTRKIPNSVISFSLGDTYTAPSGAATESGLSNTLSLIYSIKFGNHFSLGVNLNYSRLQNQVQSYTYPSIIGPVIKTNYKFIYKMISFGPNVCYNYYFSKRIYFGAGVGLNINCLDKDYVIESYTSGTSTNSIITNLYKDIYWSSFLNTSLNFHLNKSISTYCEISKNVALTSIRPYYNYSDPYKLSLNYISFVLGISYHF